MSTMPMGPREGDLSGGTTTYTYNDENRLIAMSSSLGTSQYTYDALGNRVAATDNGVTTHYMIDPMVSACRWRLQRFWRPPCPLRLRLRPPIASTGAGTAYYTYDGIGSTSELTIQGGIVANRYAYEPFGSTCSPANDPEPLPICRTVGVMRIRTG